MKDVKEVVIDYLKEKKYDGLFNSDGDCACEISDLRPCDCDFSECFPGFKRTVEELTQAQKDSLDPDCEWYMVGEL